jgi:hypothetical protein
MAIGVDDLTSDPLRAGSDRVDGDTRGRHRDLADDPVGLEDDRRQRRRAAAG